MNPGGPPGPSRTSDPEDSRKSPTVNRPGLLTIVSPEGRVATSDDDVRAEIYPVREVEAVSGNHDSPRPQS